MIQSWQKYTSSITNQTSTTELWHKVKSIRGIRSPNVPRYLIDKNGVKYSGPQAISNLLAETFANNSSDSNYNQNFLVSIPTNFNIDQEHIKTLLKTNEEEHNQSFIMSELLFVLNKCKNSTPGPDNLPNSFLKNLPDVGLEYLLQLYNHIWTTQSFPNQWREATVIPIPKPNKDHTNPTNFRPISLTCNICKLLEKMVCRRLKWSLEKQNLISPHQSAFRSFRSTNDHLVNIDSEICDALVMNHHVIAVSLDIEKAYEMVYKDRLISILADLKVKGNILDFLINFLKTRYLKVRIQDKSSQAIEMTNGLPQGSVVSVILFLIAINEVSLIVKEPVKIFLFADDITLLCSGKNLQVTSNIMQETLNNISDWANNSGFSISKTKSEFIVISKSRSIKDEKVTL